LYDARSLVLILSTIAAWEQPLR